MRVKMADRERAIEDLYAHDAERADAVVFGRETYPSRRGFLNGAGLAAMSAAVGGAIVHQATMPGGLVPAAFAQDAKPATPPAAASSAAPAPKAPPTFNFPGKDAGLKPLGDKPLVGETPEHLLDDDTTPTAKFFVRNNGQTPEPFTEGDGWKLAIDGEVNTPLELTLGDLKTRFAARSRTIRAVLECGGNGRAFFTPQARGNQWGNGGMGCAEWTGIPLSEVLKAAGLKSSAAYTANSGADQHLSGDPKQVVLSRGVPIAKAMEEEVMLVWGMNGAPLSDIHGGPLRLVIPGWPGSASHKWLTKITIRDKVHDGPGMTGTSYRVPIKPMVPGGRADEANFKIMESMPVRGIITNPSNGTRLPAGTRELALRGAAWAGDLDVKAVHVSTDFGASWQEAKMAALRNRFDWRRWTASVKLPQDGYYEIWVRATDTNGLMQPHIAGNWDPQGYGANPMHRVAVLVG
jgi:DMSO/TMAO reductase YedYZ molybdopterin-dependent catalytic subunit